MSLPPAWRGRPAANLDWHDGQPYAAEFSDNYFSRLGGDAECQHVFLRGNGVPERWRDGERFTIVETGFGTGLNFLSTWQAWRAAGSTTSLHFLSIEGFPLRLDDMQRACSIWPELKPLSDELLSQYPPGVPGLHRLLLNSGRVTLDLLYAPLDDALEILETLPNLEVDAWFLDGFAPARNQDMWTESLYQCMARLSADKASFATFTAAGDVRRGLESAGFCVNKVPGYGRKREMLQGVLSQPAARASLKATPWQFPAHRYGELAKGRFSCSPEAEEIAVLGAGLAGAATAEALARRGLKVTVYEQSDIASAASGNPQGALYTRLSHRESALNSFSLLSFCYAVRRYRALMQSGRLSDGELCGLLQLCPPLDDKDPLRDTIASLGELVQLVSPDQGRDITGVDTGTGGLYFPASGWMNPASVCRALLAHDNISVRAQLGTIGLRAGPKGWTLLGPDSTTVGEANVVVAACGAASAALVDAPWLRTQTIRGQTTQLPSQGALAALKTVICHEGYLPPARNGEHCVGATFDLDDNSVDMRPNDNDRNIRQLSRALPGLGALPDAEASATFEGRAAHRCASRDYLPVVGPVPDAQRFCENFEILGRNAKRLVARGGSYQPGLYINTCHGSRGLTSTPLCAELLAAQISGQPWPLASALAEAVAPGRFLIRDLIKGRR